jgi:Bifunctional DNA primase/polymerase, N-terminal
MTPLGEAALRLGAKGLRVFPCWPGRKEPAIRDNLRLAAVNPAIIRIFWGEAGVSNVGIATGRASGIWVLDIDADHNGEHTLREPEAKHGALGPTVEVITPGGGRHLYWHWPDGADIRNAQHRDDLPGVEGRAYEWSVDSAGTFADAPPWLIELVTRNGKSGNVVAPAMPQDWEGFMERREHEGSRRAGAVAKIFGHLVRKYVDSPSRSPRCSIASAISRPSARSASTTSRTC